MPRSAARSPTAVAAGVLAGVLCAGVGVASAPAAGDALGRGGAACGVHSQGRGTRGKRAGYATYVLGDSLSGAALFTTTSHVAESFDIVANEYAARVAEEDARVRAVEELRRDIVTRLTLFMQRRAAGA